MTASAANSAPSAMISSARVPFVANEGQVENPDVKYYARTFGGTVYALSAGKIVYSLPKYEAGKTAGSAVITEILQGAFHDQPVGAGKSAVAVSSFIGNRPEKWKSNLPVFDRLDFGEVYEGISLLLSARGNNVEKIFVLSPGADPREIAFGFEGVSDIAIMPDGKLELQTALGKVYFTRPVAWQADTSAPETSNIQHPTSNVQSSKLNVESFRHGHTPVEVSYALDEDGTVRFELGAYDQNKVLIIDPLLASTFIGGGGADAVQGMAVDSQTNVYVAGYTASSDFPTVTPYSSVLAGGQDAFISRFDGNLGVLAASTYLGGSSNDQAAAIGIAGSQIWIAGYTESTNFPCGDSSMNSNYNGAGDAFVAILNTALNSLVRATYLGGTNLDRATAIAINNLSSNQYIVGYTESDNFPVTNSIGYKTNYNGEGDAFVALFSNDVNRAGYRTGIFLGGTNADEAYGVVLTPGISPTNFVFVVGSTSSTNFPSTNGYQMTNGGSYDAFISRLSVLLTNLPASTFLGGTGSEAAYTVALDISNRVYVAGYTGSEDFPTTNSYRPYLAGGQDTFVSCLTNNLMNLCASTYIGGTGNDAARCLVVASSITTNLVYLAGYTASSNFPTTSNAYDCSYNGGGDAWTLRFDGRLTNLYASTYLGGSDSDQALALALGPESNLLFVAGITASSDFPASDAAYETAFCGGASDGFVTKFPASLAYGTLKWKKSLAADASICSSPALTWDGMVVVGNITSLYAFTSTGDERWQKVTTSSVAIWNPTILGGIGVPAVGTNNVIYINTSSGKVHAITSAGEITELFTITPQLRWSSIALGNENQIIFSQGPKLYSIGADGARQWTNDLLYNNISAASIGSNGTIYAVDSDDPANLYAVNSQGSTSNTWTTPGVMYSSPALATNGTIYTASGDKLYAFNPDGTTGQTWTAAGEIFSSPAIGANGVIYIGGGSNLYAFNTNGTTARIWPANGAVKSSPAIAADGAIIFCSASGFVYSCNSDGTTNWTFETTEFLAYQSPLIDSEGTIYVSDNDYIYAVYGSAPPAESAWPMFRHDALRTGNQGMNVVSFLRPNAPAVSKYGTFTNYIRVGWNASSNALNYELWRNTNSSTAGATRIRRLTQTNYNDSSVEGGRIYYYWLKVKTPVALSALSASDFGGIPPLPPTGVTASDGVPTNYVHVTWAASSNAATYTVWRSLSDDTNTAINLGSPTPASATNYNDYTLAPGLRHFYWVKAANAVAGTSEFSGSDHGGIPCWPPAGFSASQGASVHSVALNWNSSTGASSYIVYRFTENNSATAAIINDLTALTMSDSNVTPMRRYYYWLKTTNEFGLSGFSDPAIGWGLLAAPLSVQASGGASALSNTIRVSWMAGSTDATAHVIFRSLSSDSSTAARQSEVVVYADGTATNYDDTAITRGLSYYYWVASKNNYGSSVWTAASSPGGTWPETPLDLNASDGTDSNMVQITWSLSPGATYYPVYRNVTYNSADAALIGSAPTNSYDDISAVAGVLYYYWVKAANDSGISPLSTFNSGWRGLTPPDNVRASDGSSTSEVTVSWSASGAASYEVWRGTSDNIASAGRLVNNVPAVSSPSYSDRSANPGTVYYYWVKSKSGNYSSAFSLSDFGYMAIGLLDIGVSDFVFVPTVFGPPAHPSAVSFNVANLSGSDMIDPNNMLQYDFYLSTNAVFGDDDSRIGRTNSTLTLSAGASTRVTLPQTVRKVISIPDWATGNYYVFVFVNHCLPSAWHDPNLANNVARRAGDAISIASATAFQPVWNDYDGDGKADFALYNGLTGGWKVWLSASGYAQVDLTGFGGAGYCAVPRDYDGDGKFDPAVYEGASDKWRVMLSGSGYTLAQVLLQPTAYSLQPVPSDYDGDGRVDPAVYQESAGGWRAWLSGSGYQTVLVTGMGGAGQYPVPADYDGDGHTDPAVYQSATGGWRVWLSGSGYQEADVINRGGSGQRPVPADYDADGKIDPAVYQSATGVWRVWPSSSGYQEISVTGCGGSGQTAVPGDYDGDGRVDLVVYWQSMGIWRLWLSSYQYSEMDVLMSGGEGFSAITFWE